MAKGERPPKDWIRIGIKLDRTLAEKIDEYCSSVGQSKTTAVERMLELCLQQWEKRDKKSGCQVTLESFAEKQEEE